MQGAHPPALGWFMTDPSSIQHFWFTGTMDNKESAVHTIALEIASLMTERPAKVCKHNCQKKDEIIGVTEHPHKADS